MDIAKRIVAAYLVATAVAVVLNFILTPAYHDGSPEYPVWRILNWFMAAGVLMALVVSYLRRRTLRSGEVSTLQYLGASTMAPSSPIVLAMLFFWEWFWTLNPDSETGDAITSHTVYFPIVDALFVVVAIATGRYLWKGNGDSDG
ncbi:MAG: hypothetical protein J4F46_03045 [Dehalococcoidia bacterium]|nr:hypothetical protein [Dehalococcoidia bacterium]